MCRSQANYCGNFNCSLKYSVRSILDLFQGIGTMFAQSPQIAIARVVLIFLGFLLVYLGVKGTLEPLIMVPMGLGMSAVNAGVLFLGENQIGNLIIDPLLSTTDERTEDRIRPDTTTAERQVPEYIRRRTSGRNDFFGQLR